MVGSSQIRQDRVRGTVPRVRRARSVRAGIALLLLLLQLTGCFHYVPTTSSSLPAGARVSLAVSDAGRVQLAEQVGPGVRQLGGTVVTSGDSTLLVSVASVQFIDVPIPVRWNGERVQLSRGFLSEVRERRLSKRRTWIMAGVLTVGAYLFSRLAITGFGTDPNENGSGEDDAHQ